MAKEYFVSKFNMRRFHKICEYEHIPYIIHSSNERGYKLKMDVSRSQFKMLMEKALCDKRTRNSRTPYISAKIAKDPKALGSVLSRYKTKSAKMDKRDVERLLGYTL